MTFVEFLLACGLIGVALTIAAGLYDHSLNRAKAAQTQALIAALARAAGMYQSAAGAYPPGRDDAICDRALSAMYSIPDSAKVLREFPGRLLHWTGGLPRCVDPWGRPVRYLTERTEQPDHRRRLLQNGGVPIFESAGPDRDFGDADPAAQADNIRGDDPT